MSQADSTSSENSYELFDQLIFSIAILLITLAALSIIALSLWYLISPISFQVKLHTPKYPAKLENGDSVEKNLRRWCSSLEKGYKPSWWLPNGHIQTMYASIAAITQDQLKYYRQLIRVADGGTIGLDIYPPLDVELDSSAPIVIINHGLTGGSHESYIRNMVVAVTKPWEEGGLGGRAAVLNFRGCANTPVTSAHLYNSGSTLDIHTVTLHLSTLFPESPLFSVGFSLGAALLTRYLGEEASRCRLNAGVVLCAPLELKEMCRALDAKRFLAKLYSWSMARFMLKSWLHLIQEESPLSSPTSPLHPHLKAIVKMTKNFNITLRVSQVVEMFLSKVGGSEDHFPFVGIQEFMEWSCPGAWLGGIKRPTLAMSALDDPVVPGAYLPFTAVKSSSHFILATVPHGGHLGWFEGPLKGPNKHSRWHTKPTIEFFKGVLSDIVYAYDEKQSLMERSVDYDGWTWVDGVRWKVMAEFEVSTEELSTV